MKFFIALLLAPLSSTAMTLDWTGGYRVEWTQLDRPSLAVPSASIANSAKQYGTNYLFLNPQIIATDGLTIRGRLEVFGGQYPYDNSQLGQLWGLGLDKSGTPADTSRTNATSRGHEFTNVQVSQLYMIMQQEYGSLLVGRAPLHFGLGMTHNAGSGAFDHWSNTQDLVGYKFIVDNTYFMPIFSRHYQNGYTLDSVIQSEIYQLVYENASAGNLLGVMIEKRRAGGSVNDVAVGTNGFGGTGATRNGGMNLQYTNFLLGRDWEEFHFKFEGGQAVGDLGVQDSGLNNVRMNGNGMLVDMSYEPKGSKWTFGGKFGMASGDNPTTSDFEGYHFDPNINIGLMLFSHRLGNNSGDFMTTAPYRNMNLTNATSADDESVGNATFLAPQVSYAWNDKLDLKGTFVYATAMANPGNFSDFKKDLGMEFDFELVYKPREKFQWKNQFGILMPGAAFKGGSTNDWETGTCMGFNSSAAITF